MGKCFKDLKVGDYIYIVSACCARKEKITNIGISKKNMVWIITDAIRRTDCGECNNAYFNINGEDGKLPVQREFSYELVFPDGHTAEEYIQEHFVESLKG